MLTDRLPDGEIDSSSSEEIGKVPENRLMLAVLQDALATFQRGLSPFMRKDIEAFREVDRWFRSRDYDSVFAFESICFTLNIDAGCLRVALNEWKRNAFMNRAAAQNRTLLRKTRYARGGRAHRLG